jgi:tetratricopeptide (TPR) repeat protein
MTVAQQIRIDHEYAHYFGTLEDRIKYAKQYEILDDQEPVNIYTIASNYYHLGQFDLAIPEFEKALELYDRFGYDPSATWTIYELGIVYHKTGQLKKEKNLYKKAEKEFPDNPDLIYRQAILSLTEGDDKDANRFIEKYRYICKENLWTEADIVTDLAKLYSDAGIPEKGEKYFRQALLLIEPASDNSWYVNNLARFLIDKDRNINEGLELIKKPLDLNPENYEYLDTEGWGLYKQGKYQEAYSNLQKSWDLRMKYDIYNYEAYLHLEAAKKAVANQK